MMILNRINLCFILICTLFLSAGCSLIDTTPQPDPTRFYVLNTVAGKTQPFPRIGFSQQKGPLIAIDRVRLPRYLSANKIVTFSSANEVHYAVFQLWAEPLANGIARVIAENITQRTGITDIAWGSTDKVIRPRVRVNLECSTFSLQPDQKVHLQVRWSLAGPKGILATPTWERLFISESVTVTADDYQPLVATMSQLLGVFSDQLTQDIIATLAQQAVVHDNGE